MIWLAPTFAASFVAAFFLRFDGSIPDDARALLWGALPAVVGVKTAAFSAARMSRSCHAFVSMHDVFRLLQASFVATACIALLDFFFFPIASIPRGVVVIDGCLTTLLVGGILTLRRRFREHWTRPFSAPAGSPLRVLLLGGPAAVESMIRASSMRRRSDYQPLGILTNEAKILHRAIGGVPVLGRLEDIEQVVRRVEPQMLILACGDLPGSELRHIMTLAERLEKEVRIVPELDKILGGTLDFRPRDVAIEDLLGRPAVDFGNPSLQQWLRGKRVLVTGSCGSIGSEIVRQLLPMGTEKIFVLDRSENGQFHLGRELQREVEQGQVEIIIADVNDFQRMNSIFRRLSPEVVFHAAAYKHVPLMELHPGEGVRNIIGATKNLADLSHACGVETFVMISTDKAVNPTSVMGCCKRVAELYIQSMSRRSDCRFITVRFGNVLGSAGSVIPIFREQIACGGPITVTHPEMTRYFMTIPEASQLVIQAASMGNGGEIFVLDMGTPVRIMDLAHDMVRLSGLRLGHDIEIAITGLRPGEKLFEELYAQEEEESRTAHAKILKAHSVEVPHPVVSKQILAILSAADAEAEEIRRLLKEIVPSFATLQQQAPAATATAQRRAS